MNYKSTSPISTFDCAFWTFFLMCTFQVILLPNIFLTCIVFKSYFNKYFLSVLSYYVLLFYFFSFWKCAFSISVHSNFNNYSVCFLSYLFNAFGHFVYACFFSVLMANHIFQANCGTYFLLMTNHAKKYKNVVPVRASRLEISSDRWCRKTTNIYHTFIKSNADVLPSSRRLRANLFSSLIHCRESYLWEIFYSDKNSPRCCLGRNTHYFRINNSSSGRARWLAHFFALFFSRQFYKSIFFWLIYRVPIIGVGWISQIF